MSSALSLANLLLATYLGTYQCLEQECAFCSLGLYSIPVFLACLRACFSRGVQKTDMTHHNHRIANFQG